MGPFGELGRLQPRGNLQFSKALRVADTVGCGYTNCWLGSKIGVDWVSFASFSCKYVGALVDIQRRYLSCFFLWSRPLVNFVFVEVGGGRRVRRGRAVAVVCGGGVCLGRTSEA